MWQDSWVTTGVFVLVCVCACVCVYVCVCTCVYALRCVHDKDGTSAWTGMGGSSINENQSIVVGLSLVLFLISKQEPNTRASVLVFDVLLVQLMVVCISFKHTPSATASASWHSSNRCCSLVLP